MKKIATFVLLFILPLEMFTQRNEFDKGKIYRQAEIIKDKNGVRYSTIIRVGFKKQNLDLPRDVKEVKIEDFINQEVREAFKLINDKYGSFKLVKSFPNSSPGDTIIFSKILNRHVKQEDYSQKITLKFTSLVPIDSIINFFQKQKSVEYAIGPWEFQLAAEPNDQYFQISRWAYDKTELTKAWDITKSNSTIKIGIVDVFENGITTLHSDLQGKISVPNYWTNEYGGHGLIVSGIAGALTGNSTGIAASGWNSTLLLEQAFRDGPNVAIDSARSRGAHVINCSFIQTYDQDVRAAVFRAIQSGVIVVAATGNSELGGLPIPSVIYPAATTLVQRGRLLRRPHQYVGMVLMKQRYQVLTIVLARIQLMIQLILL
ncbi:MAG: S8 family serine peptidase [Bacteroidota bacterium]